MSGREAQQRVLSLNSEPSRLIHHTVRGIQAPVEGMGILEFWLLGYRGLIASSLGLRGSMHVEHSRSKRAKATEEAKEQAQETRQKQEQKPAREQEPKQEQEHDPTKVAVEKNAD